MKRVYLASYQDQGKTRLRLEGPGGKTYQINYLEIKERGTGKDFVEIGSRGAKLIPPDRHINILLGTVLFGNYYGEKYSHYFRHSTLTVFVDSFTLNPTGTITYEKGFITQKAPVYEIKELSGIKYVDKNHPDETYKENIRTEVEKLYTERLEIYKKAKALYALYEKNGDKLRELDPLGRIKQNHRNMLKAMGEETHQRCLPFYEA